MCTLIIDNYDSFTFNLVQLVGSITGIDPLVIPNDSEDLARSLNDNISSIILSPGPGRPDRTRDFGICSEVIRGSSLPILGVCLGHQGIAHVLGGAFDHAPTPMHGRISAVHHNGQELFDGIDTPFNAVRYHSFVVTTLPPEFEATAYTEDGLIMAFRHRFRPLWGVQFHPESVETQFGERLLENFLNLSKRDGRLESTSIHRPSRPRFSRETQSRLNLFAKKLDILPNSERVFETLFRSSPTAFWLDSSAVIPGRSRYSFIGDNVGPRSELIRYDVNTEFVEVVKGDCLHKEDGNIFEYLKRRLPQVHVAGQEEMPPFVGGYVGYFGYELKAETGGSRLHKSEQYDAQFIFADRVIAIDHFEKKTWLLCLEELNEKKRAETWISETEEAIRSIPVVSRALDRSAESAQLRFVHQREQYLSLIESALHEITNGESYEVCLTNRLVGPIFEDPLDAYLALRRSNPAPYAGYFRFSDVHILSCSPERFVSVDRCGNVESKPIKGTIRRGVTEDEDRQLKKTLELSEKDRAENLMIVDLIRNDLGKVCLTGSVKVPKFCDIETFASVHQMVTTVVGKLRADRDPIDCIRALFPGGSMTGAPKVRTMEIIDRLENMPRGIYSGSIGYLSADGTVDLNIVIRTAVLQNGRAVVGTGGALVALSNPEAEFEEIVLKSRIINETLGNSLRSDV